MATSKQQVATFLTFSGQAEEAMNLYLSLFDRAELVSIRRYGPNEAGAEGSVLHATFTLAGQTFICSDSSIEHAWTFTPAISLCVTCNTGEEIDRLYTSLSQDGEDFMPLQAYPFSAKFAWVRDRFGISWQLKLGLVDGPEQSSR
jgi:predicted 3-demethylubiquinone-9 3-methyltransferase (glyoxalase superfamily)